jgi:uncharacterized integral membrane protein
MRRIGRWMAALVVAVAVVVFAVQNDAFVRVRFLAWRTPRVHLAVLLAIAVVVGALITALVGWPVWWRERQARMRAASQAVSARPAEPGFEAANGPLPEPWTGNDAPGAIPSAAAGDDSPEPSR